MIGNGLGVSGSGPAVLAAFPHANLAMLAAAIISLRVLQPHLPRLALFKTGTILAGIGPSA
jgi:hypothetical protein